MLEAKWLWHSKRKPSNLPYTLCYQQHSIRLLNHFKELYIYIKVCCNANNSTNKKVILSTVLYISKFRDNILNQKFLVCFECKSAKDVLLKDVKNITSKQSSAQWQAILISFDFEIEYIKWEANHIPNFLTHEFVQGKWPLHIE